MRRPNVNEDEILHFTISTGKPKPVSVKPVINEISKDIRNKGKAN